MSGTNPTVHPVFFKPLPQHDTLQTAYLLWKLAEKVRVAPSGCWEWIGERTRDGYGRIGLAKHRLERVHRLVYRLCVALIPPDSEVCHNCPNKDNPACCNPAHLFLGSHSDNMRDAAAKGTVIPPPLLGDEHPGARLTSAKVRAIRVRWRELEGVVGRANKLAAEFGVSLSTARRAATGLLWRHVE